MDNFMITLAGIGMFILIGLSVAYLVFGIWCARRRDSILEQCRGCLTKWNTRWYANFKILIYLGCPLIFIGSMAVIVMILAGVENFSDIPIFQVAISPLLCIGIFFFGLWRTKALEKKILNFYGEENYKEIKKLAFLAGLGTMFKFAFRFIHFTALTMTISAFDTRIMLEDGSTLQMMRLSDGTFMDTSGNTYRQKYGNVFEPLY